MNIFPLLLDEDTDLVIVKIHHKLHNVSSHRTITDFFSLFLSNVYSLYNLHLKTSVANPKVLSKISLSQ